MGAGGVLSKEASAGSGLVIGGILSKEVEGGVGTDVVLGWVLAVALKERQGCGPVASEGGVLFKSTGLEVNIGLGRATGAKPEVVFEVGIVVIDAGEEFDTVTGVLETPAAELKEGL